MRDEREFQNVVGNLARHSGVLHYHTHDSRRSESGFPDSVFVGRGVKFRELKLTRRSRVRPEQRTWLDRLSAAGADAGIWYAEDYYSGLIERQLDDLAESVPARGLPPEPIALQARVAKRLFLSSATGNPYKAELFWDAGIVTVDHDAWMTRAEQALTALAAELPATTGEYDGWLSRHQLGAGAGLARVFTALRTDLTATAAPPARS